MIDSIWLKLFFHRKNLNVNDFPKKNPENSSNTSTDIKTLFLFNLISQ